MGVGRCCLGSSVRRAGRGFWSMGFVLIFLFFRLLFVLHGLILVLWAVCWGYPRLRADCRCVYEGEQEPAEPHFRYIMTGTLDQPDALPPKGEFFCKNRSAWMPEVPGECLPGWEGVE